MTILPGDPEYVSQVVAPQLAELGTRLDDEIPTMEGFVANVQGIAAMVGALALDEDDNNVKTAAQGAAERAMAVVGSATEVLDGLIQLAGFSEDDQADDGEAAASGDGEDDGAGDKDGGSPADPLEQAVLSLLPEAVRNLPEDERRDALGDRIFPLTIEELKANQDLLSNAEATVVVSEDGSGLRVLEGERVDVSTNTLPATVVHVINMYNRLVLSKFGEFRKSDITGLFGPKGNNFDSLAKAFDKTHSTLGMELGLPGLFDDNGQSRGAARYWATGKVVFVPEELAYPDGRG